MRNNHNPYQRRHGAEGKSVDDLVPVGFITLAQIQWNHEWAQQHGHHHHGSLKNQAEPQCPSGIFFDPLAGPKNTHWYPFRNENI